MCNCPNPVPECSSLISPWPHLELKLQPTAHAPNSSFHLFISSQTVYPFLTSFIFTALVHLSSITCLHHVYRNTYFCGCCFVLFFLVLESLNIQWMTHAGCSINIHRMNECFYITCRKVEKRTSKHIRPLKYSDLSMQSRDPEAGADKSQLVTS